MEDRPKASSEQIAYAKILDVGMKVGILALVVTFAIYVTGIIEPNTPYEDLPDLWGRGVKAEEYVEATGGHDGWSWVTELDKSDFLNYTGVAFLAAVTVICYARLTPMLFARKDYVYGLIAIAEIVVLVLAVSGILKTGGH